MAENTVTETKRCAKCGETKPLGRWAVHKDQMRNFRRNRIIEYQGRRQCVSAWAEEFDIPIDTLKQRINKLGWSAEKALTKPRRARRSPTARGMDSY